MLGDLPNTTEDESSLDLKMLSRDAFPRQISISDRISFAILTLYSIPGVEDVTVRVYYTNVTRNCNFCENLFNCFDNEVFKSSRIGISYKLIEVSFDTS